MAKWMAMDGPLVHYLFNGARMKSERCSLPMSANKEERSRHYRGYRVALVNYRRTNRRIERMQVRDED